MKDTSWSKATENVENENPDLQQFVMGFCNQWLPGALHKTIPYRFPIFQLIYKHPVTDTTIYNFWESSTYIFDAET